MEEPEETTLRRIHDLKREMLVVRRAVWPLRDVMSQLLRSDHRLVADETKVFLRDVYDHAIQALDTVETLRDLASGLTDLYLSSVGHRQNEVMKVLTIMASIFIPLTFLAGIYGMNFEDMPELGLSWAYPALLGLMAVVAGSRSPGAASSSRSGTQGPSAVAASPSAATMGRWKASVVSTPSSSQA